MFPPWWKNRPLLIIMAVALVLRLVVLLAWIDKPCVRDECTYLGLADTLIAGKGMLGTHGWLWAPAYPVLVAIHQLVTGYGSSIEVTQIGVAVASVAMIHHLARLHGGERAANVAAWLYALNPTMIFYASSLWSETLYSGLLLAGTVSLGLARSGGARRGWLPGALIGACVLFRGVATYLLPIFLIGILWGRWRDRAAWRGAIACAVAAVLTVAPYSLYASNKWGAFVVADRTVGQMMWLGNNDFPPITFDTGNGQLSERQYERTIDLGRGHCSKRGNPIVQDDCELAAGLSWIRANPTLFVARMPMRVAQLVNPHTFLTRHLRWGRWRGLPDVIDEVIVVTIVGFSFVTLAAGTLGFITRARGWYGAASGLTVLYHVAAISVLAGLSRYRLPLEPLWLVWAAPFCLAPRESMARASPTRRALAVFVTTLLIGLMGWYLPAGWPMWRSW